MQIFTFSKQCVAVKCDGQIDGWTDRCIINVHTYQTLHGGIKYTVCSPDKELVIEY